MARDLLASLGNLATEEPEWTYTHSSNVVALRLWKEHPSWHRPVIEVHYKSGRTYGYSAGANTFRAILGSGSRGKAVNRLLKPLGFIFDYHGM